MAAVATTRPFGRSSAPISRLVPDFCRAAGAMVVAVSPSKINLIRAPVARTLA